MEEQLLEDLETYLDERDEDLLLLLIRRAMHQVRVKRNYPESWDEEKIAANLEKYRYIVFDAVVYAYGKMGAEGQQSHSENGISRSWIDEGKLYADVIPFVTVL